jgi:cell division septation protein DedD
MPGASELARALNEWEGARAGVTFAPDAMQAIWRWSVGLPRLINLTCDRALEAAFAQRRRTIDADLVETAAIALGLRSAPLAGPVASVFAPAEPGILPVAGYVEPVAPIPRTRTTGIVAAAALIVVVATMAWFAIRAPAGRVDGVRTTPVEGSAATSAPAVAPSIPTPPAGSAAQAAPASPPSATPSPERGSTPSAAAAPDAILPGFEILVASFRTEARAAAVAAQVTDAGLPARQRGVGGWQQVIAGPFPSREAADAARQRLEGAGLAGTQIVLTGR